MKNITKQFFAIIIIVFDMGGGGPSKSSLLASTVNGTIWNRLSFRFRTYLKRR